MHKRMVGVVKGDKMNKSRRVEVERTYKHAKYGKTVRSRTICHMHDEENASQDGDIVEIVECRPRSRLKRWELVRIVTSVTGDKVAAEAATESAAEAPVA